MRRRTPGGRDWESHVERQIREAQERGAFDNLPSAGRPLADLDRPHDEAWWIRRKLREERFDQLPPALQLRRDVQQARERIARARTEREVREIITTVNAHIRYVNRTIVHGPPSTVMPLDEAATIAAWRATRPQEPPVG